MQKITKNHYRRHFSLPQRLQLYSIPCRLCLIVIFVAVLRFRSSQNNLPPLSSTSLLAWQPPTVSTNRYQGDGSSSNAGWNSPTHRYEAPQLLESKAVSNPEPSGGPPKSPFAYAYLIAGCDPSHPSRYLGYLYGIMIAVESLQDSGSQADHVVMIQMSHKSATATLPQESWLKKLGVRVMYLPRPSVVGASDRNFTRHSVDGHDDNEDFCQAQMLKFHILHLTDYQRVLFLDGDVMPLCNLDYLFELSMVSNVSTETAPYLLENLIVSWTDEPAWGGFFLLRPGPREYEELLDIIDNQAQENNVHLSRQSPNQHPPYPHFDVLRGWGHVIPAGDEWSAWKKRGVLWDFNAADCDQGLLYHWTKYVKQKVVIISNRAGEWWQPANNGTVVVMTQKKEKALAGHSCLPPVDDTRQLGFSLHPAYRHNLMYNVPYGDFVHFYGPFKPWLQREIPSNHDHVVTSKWEAPSALSYWFFLLRRLNERLSMGIDLAQWPHPNTAV